MTALSLIVFDVNEILRDLQTMHPKFQRVFGEASAMCLWFDVPGVGPQPQIVGDDINNVADQLIARQAAG